METPNLDTADTYRYGVFGSGLSVSLKPTKWKHQIQILVESGSAVSISLKPMKHIQSAIEVVDNLYLKVSGVSVWLKPKKWIHHIQIHQIPPGTSSGQPVPGSIWCIRFVGFNETDTPDTSRSRLWPTCTWMKPGPRLTPRSVWSGFGFVPHLLRNPFIIRLELGRADRPRLLLLRLLSSPPGHSRSCRRVQSSNGVNALIVSHYSVALPTLRFCLSVRCLAR